MVGWDTGRALRGNMRKNWGKWLDGTQVVDCGEGLLDQWSQKLEPLPMWLKFGT